MGRCPPFRRKIDSVAQSRLRRVILCPHDGWVSTTSSGTALRTKTRTRKRHKVSNGSSEAAHQTKEPTRAPNQSSRDQHNPEHGGGSSKHNPTHSSEGGRRHRLLAQGVVEVRLKQPRERRGARGRPCKTQGDLQSRYKSGGRGGGRGDDANECKVVERRGVGGAPVPKTESRWAILRRITPRGCP